MLHEKRIIISRVEEESFFENTDVVYKPNIFLDQTVDFMPDQLDEDEIRDLNEVISSKQ